MQAGVPRSRRASWGVMASGLRSRMARATRLAQLPTVSSVTFRPSQGQAGSCGRWSTTSCTVSASSASSGGSVWWSTSTSSSWPESRSCRRSISFLEDTRVGWVWIRGTRCIIPALIVRLREGERGNAEGRRGRVLGEIRWKWYRLETLT